MNIDLEKVRGIKWAETTHWEVQFSTIPKSSYGVLPDGFGAKDSSWFPATEVREDYFSIGLKTFDLGVTTVSIPNSINPRQIRITFLDDDHLHIHSWLRGWASAMFPNRLYVAPVGTIYLVLTVRKYLSNNATYFSENIYWVFPKGDLGFNGTSTAGILSNSMDFAVINFVNKTT